jgi:hypothetical protein
MSAAMAMTTTEGPLGFPLTDRQAIALNAAWDSSRCFAGAIQPFRFRQPVRELKLCRPGQVRSPATLTAPTQYPKYGFRFRL